MSLTTGSFEDVDAWAMREFPVSYAALCSSSCDEVIEIEIGLDGDCVDGNIVWQPLRVICVSVGSSTDRKNIWACLSDSNGVDFFRIEKMISPGILKPRFYRKPVMCVADTTLKAPFEHLIQTGHPAGVNRLEAIIRYLLLENDDVTVVHSELDFFMAHFRDACRDVARGMGALVEDDEMDGSDTLPG